MLSAADKMQTKPGSLVGNSVLKARNTSESADNV